MEEKPNYFAIIPAHVRYNNNLNSSQKLFYGEVTALTYKTGECWASNSYFSKLYDVSPSLITNWINALEKEHLIAVDYEKKGNEIIKRIIRITGIQNIEQVFNKSVEGYSKYLKENNTSNNKTSKKEIYKERFKKPSLEEIEKYIKENDLNVDAKEFLKYYTDGKWIDSRGQKVRNWKLKVRTWNSFSKPKETVPEWFEKESTSKELSKEELKEMEEILDGLHN